MNEEQFRHLTRALALDVFARVESLPRIATADVIGNQRLPSAASVGANCRASCRGRSLQEIVAKLSIVEEEADETAYWMELLVLSGSVQADRVKRFCWRRMRILATTVASKKTLKARAGIAGFARNRQSEFVNRES